MERRQSPVTGRMRRRAALRLLTGGGVLALLSACGAPASPPATAAGPAAQPPTSAPVATTAPPAATTSAPPTGTPRTGGTLNVTLGDLGSENNDVIVAAINNVVPLICEPLLSPIPRATSFRGWPNVS